MKVSIEVLVDSTGDADMATFKVSGLGAVENRDALYSWIDQAIFSPGRQNGRPVRALYRTSLQARVER